MNVVSARYAELDDDAETSRPFFCWFMCVRCKKFLDSPDYNGKWIEQEIDHHQIFVEGCLDKYCGFCLKPIPFDETVSLIIPGQSDFFFHRSNFNPPDWYRWFGRDHYGCILLTDTRIEIDT